MVIWCSNCQNPQRNLKTMTEITAQSAGVANMLLSKWSVVAFSISEKALLHSRTSRILRNLSHVTFVDHKNGCSFLSAALSCWQSSTVDLNCTVLPWISLLASVGTGSVSKPRLFFFKCCLKWFDECVSHLFIMQVPFMILTAPRVTLGISVQFCTTVQLICYTFFFFSNFSAFQCNVIL